MIDRIKLCAGVLLSCATVLGATGGCVGRPGASGEGSTGGDSGGGGSSDTGSSDTGSSGTGSSGTGSSGTGSSGTGGGSQSVCDVAGTIHAGRAPIRRLTRFEFNNTVRDLLGDTTFPGDAFPSEESGNGFGNDADAQPVASLLAEQYNTVAEAIANRIVTTPALYARFAPCAAKATTEATEEACVRSIAERFAASAYRRPLEAGEADGLVALEKLIRTKSDFKTSLSALIEAVLQSPDFLYRVEWGKRDADGHLRPSGYEMATRLSYFLWGTQPDQTLLAAAVSGELETKTGVLTQATRLLADPQARSVVRFFFDNLLPISGLSQLERDAKRYPKFSSQVGALMREETETFLDNEIFAGSGTWVGALTAPYTFVNGPLATFYGIPGVTGDAFQKVDLDTTQRLGLLTQAGIVAGTIHSNDTNPVVRGSFIVQKLMCRTIPFPTGDIAAKVSCPGRVLGQDGAPAVLRAQHGSSLRELSSDDGSDRARLRELRSRGPVARHRERREDRCVRVAARHRRGHAGAHRARPEDRRLAGHAQLLRFALAELRVRADPRGRGRLHRVQRPGGVRGVGDRRPGAAAFAHADRCVSVLAREEGLIVMAKPFQLSRRAVLRGAGIAIALPWLEAMGFPREAQAANPAKRFVTVFQPGGTVLDNLKGENRWRPTGTETNFTLSPILAPLEPIRKKLLVVDGLSMKSAMGEQHQAGIIAWLTGTTQDVADQLRARRRPSIR